uniref:Uncharacterized protein n=1 Tax=Bactrocera latifrons TaxID=174628 RepID=A0A0K8WGQ8_BACLA
MSRMLFLLLCVLFALQFTAFAHPLEDGKDTQEVADNKPPNAKNLIPDTPGVQEFKKDIVSHLVASLGNEEGDDSGVYSAQLSSAEVDLPCTNDSVRIAVISSSFPLPERFFHTPKRCSDEVQ